MLGEEGTKNARREGGGRRREAFVFVVTRSKPTTFALTCTLATVDMGMLRNL
jgi:hypothetical protein